MKITKKYNVIILTEAPTEDTYGEVGQRLINKSNGDEYTLSSISYVNGVYKYHWSPIDYIEDYSIGVEKLKQELIDKHLSLPVFKKSIAGVVDENYYNTLTEQGIYKIDSYSGAHEVLLVVKPESQAYLMQLLFKYDKILYRGVLCAVDGEYADEDWQEWTDLTAEKMDKADTFFGVSNLDENVDPEIVAYQTTDPETNEMLRIPLSVLESRRDFIRIKGGEYDLDFIEEFQRYPFENNKTYSFFMGAENELNVPYGEYIGCLGNEGVFDFQPLTPNGMHYQLSLTKGTLSKRTMIKDFIDMGEFDTLDKLMGIKNDIRKYDEWYRKIYRVDIITPIVTTNNITIDKGVYVCRYYSYVNGGIDSDFLELVPFVPNGKVWTFDVYSGNCEVVESGDNFIMESNPNCHAEYFTVSDTGELSLKPEYRGATSKPEYINSISDMGADVVGSLNSELPKDLVIPEVVNEIAVDRLTNGMFVDNNAIESLTFPITIDEIPEQCCHLAVNLRTLKNTEHIRKIGTRAFASCRLEKVMFPNLEELSGSFVFLYNPHLIYADLGKVETIPANTFTDNLVLTRVKADNVKTVGNYGFLSTPKLINADFIKNLTSIGDNGFWRSNIEFDWGSLTGCTFGTGATSLQGNPTDFWSGLTFTPCENPLPTQLCQKDERWIDRDIGDSGVKYKDGCYLMSAIHAYCGLNNLKLTSVTEFEDIVNAINPELLNQFGATAATTKSILIGLGLSSSYWNRTMNAEYLNEMYKTLKNGGYVLAEIGTNNGRHAITIYGINEKGEFLCLDSEKKYFYDSSKPARYSLPYHKLILGTRSISWVLVTK